VQTADNECSCEDLLSPDVIHSKRFEYKEEWRNAVQAIEQLFGRALWPTAKQTMQNFSDVSYWLGQQYEHRHNTPWTHHLFQGTDDIQADNI